MADSLLDLADMLDSWLIALRGQNKSPATLRAYRAGVRAFLEYCAAHEIPAELTKQNLVGFMAELIEAECEPATARLRLTALKLFARWLADEEDFDDDQIQAVRPPKLEQRVVQHLTDREIDAILKACDGPELRDKRDKALVMLFVETGVRASEMLALKLEDVNVADRSAVVVRGKGGKGRRVTFSPQAAAALDRYMRARKRAGGVDGPLWIGPHGPLTYSGVKVALRRRAETAGVPKFHLHRFRHSAAVQWLSAGGSESGLMARGGWQSRHMIDRYTKSANESLAADEFDRLKVGFNK